MSRYAVVCDGEVTNVCMWDGKSAWDPGEGCTVHKLPDDSPAGVGWTRAGNGRFVAPKDEPAPEPQAVPVTVDPAALAAFVQAVTNPDVDTRQALADFAQALSSDPA